MIPDGAFVRCNFPFSSPPEARTRPDPTPHIAYMIGSRSIGGRVVRLLLAYTSSGPWRGEATGTPPGVIEFGAAEAKALNQKPFHVDLRCLAWVEPTSAWFPNWDEPGHGVVASATGPVRTRLDAELNRLVTRSRELIEYCGLPG